MGKKKKNHRVFPLALKIQICFGMWGGFFGVNSLEGLCGKSQVCSDGMAYEIICIMSMKFCFGFCRPVYVDR